MKSKQLRGRSGLLASLPFSFLLKIMIPWLNLTFSSLTPGGERGVLPTGGSVGGGVEEEREGGGQEGERFNHPRCEGKGSSLRENKSLVISLAVL